MQPPESSPDTQGKVSKGQWEVQAQNELAMLHFKEDFW